MNSSCVSFPIRPVSGVKATRQGRCSIGEWPSRHFAATQQFGRFRSEADIERFSVCTEPVAFDPHSDIDPPHCGDGLLTTLRVPCRSP